ncbi:MAG: hypothetical protein NTX04_13450 [Verrucomicrobia bacterium]|nr:hypothetical protein [Verrucomicrobiota bacterium]
MFTPIPLRLLAFLCAVSAAIAAPKPIIVATYNLENYLGVQPVAEGEKVHAKPKTEASIVAVIAVIKEIQPDILGVCEMGSPERFEDFKSRSNISKPPIPIAISLSSVGFQSSPAIRSPTFPSTSMAISKRSAAGSST